MVRDVRRARTWRGRAGYLFGPPGWREAEAAAPSRRATVPASAPAVPAPASGSADGSADAMPAGREDKEAVPV